MGNEDSEMERLGDWGKRGRQGRPLIYHQSNAGVMGRNTNGLSGVGGELNV
jgi:hypothetical protein